MQGLKRYLLISFGTLSLILGLLGIILPLLPTTPLLLLSAYCYGKSSNRLHQWLLDNRWLGKYIKQFKAGEGIPLRAKITILLLLWVSTSYSIIVLIPFIFVKILLALVVVWVTFFIINLKTKINIKET
ncbi:YbaN family protein [Aquibacillus koreensis]|uniref:YbaN family protein n=1 Tax=Aquibacillus koreensis TaxID=279446 RepID=A0A9X3WK45_9BACI|nr:YbaN family protein [Aquibacillus koreensis]MCT2535887.1 YbaN family protein [Aquibacillus koreensis]MDC3420343.1 YbaN family protein [Aquibacillus koreensis]